MNESWDSTEIRPYDLYNTYAKRVGGRKVAYASLVLVLYNIGMNGLLILPSFQYFKTIYFKRFLFNCLPLIFITPRHPNFFKHGYVFES